MKTSEFILVAEKLAKTGLIRVSKKGEHDNFVLGRTCIGGTDLKNSKLWRKCGTLENIIVFKTASEANSILKQFGITEFTAKPTKSRTMCRLIEVKK